MLFGGGCTTSTKHNIIILSPYKVVMVNVVVNTMSRGGATLVFIVSVVATQSCLLGVMFIYTTILSSKLGSL